MSAKPKAKPKAKQDGGPTANAQAANSMWGGRFDSAPGDLMTQINASIGFDRRLYAQDIAASKAHAAMLVAQGIIPASDGDKILAGLDSIREEIEHGNFVFKTELEDIHMNVEARLTEMIGAAAGRLHTARSRNDQVATDFRLWVRDALSRSDQEMGDLQAALIARAEQHAATVMPGFTHLQSAQPVTFGHHLLAYVEMLGRDRGRVADCLRRLNECPLGAAALAGTSFPIDRQASAAALGFDRPCANSIDAVSDRDFALEALATAAIAATHLSRLAEELVIWSSVQFAFIRLSDRFSTGSSIMPQKRNPDAAELVRAKTGRISGALVALLTVMKGLALSYAKDMQEDKEPVFDAFDSLSLCLRATTGMIADLEVDRDAMAAAAGAGHATATELADWLVRELGMPFREAHHVTGRVVRRADELSCRLDELSLAELQAIEPQFAASALNVLSPAKAVESRASYGGTAPDQVREQIRLARERFL
jgi:argininosuccinate lyase